jgi:hypothetical protein
MPHDLPDWLFTKVIPEPMSGCWLWFGSVDKLGYGWVRLGRHKGKQFNHPAHRLIYEFYNGPVSESFVMDHLCRNPGCVNPEHQEPVPAKINVLRGQGVSAKNAQKTHCPFGHSLEDAYIVDGCRKCRKCQKLRMKILYRAKKGDI